MYYLLKTCDDYTIIDFDTNCWVNSDPYPTWHKSIETIITWALNNGVTSPDEIDDDDPIESAMSYHTNIHDWIEVLRGNPDFIDISLVLPINILDYHSIKQQYPELFL